ncbi:hypothetical protein BDV95DRAFT_12511 [Massariosphaeria phaeospora]|uniref:Uncharacterized protein n=1 Tax=Massariosphaeria phaeospora TaxID=100035 RepID=A0A7C8IF72_9PLEO|nr:hypothetical protein BDV95DRAFT_12511 [Massariosphaeria phaeospora]
MSRLTRPSMSRNESMQRYMLLSSQQEVLRRRLSLHVPSASPMTASSPELQSLSSSPTSRTPELEFTSAYPSAVAAFPAHARGNLDDCDDAHRLRELNEQIKATLTELLNTDSVRSDDKYRAWVQGRLMDAEQQIRKQRRRRSSGSDREFASSIAEHFDYSLAPPKTFG